MFTIITPSTHDIGAFDVRRTVHARASFGPTVKKVMRSSSL